MILLYSKKDCDINWQFENCRMENWRFENWRIERWRFENWIIESWRSGGRDGY